MYKTVNGAGVEAFYETRQEAEYYAKKTGAKVFCRYEIFDANKGLMSDNTFIEAKTPLHAAQIYAKLNGFGGVRRDLSATGSLVVYPANGRHNSWVYECLRKGE